jgi:hypothetical protein
LAVGFWLLAFGFWQLALGNQQKPFTAKAQDNCICYLGGKTGGDSIAT